MGTHVAAGAHDADERRPHQQEGAALEREWWAMIHYSAVCAFPAAVYHSLCCCVTSYLPSYIIHIYITEREYDIISYIYCGYCTVKKGESGVEKGYIYFICTTVYIILYIYKKKANNRQVSRTLASYRK